MCAPEIARNYRVLSRVLFRPLRVASIDPSSELREGGGEEKRKPG